MEIYTKDYTVNFSYIDNRATARPSAIADFMQDTATLHAVELQISREDIGGFWVLTKLKYNIKRPLKPYETITVSTWCGAVKGVSFYRHFSFFAGDEEIGNGVTVWVVISDETRKIMRPADVKNYEKIMELGEQSELLNEVATGWGITPATCDLISPPPILRRGKSLNRYKMERIEKIDCDTFDSHKVTYSDIDINNHLNNVKIIDIISDSLRLSDSEKFVSEIQVSYIKESYIDQNIEIALSNNGDTAYIIGKRAEAPVFEAKVKLNGKL